MSGLFYEDITSSGTFRFLVGPQKRVFTMHTALVASQSESLGNLVHNDSFKEAREGEVDFQAVDEKTFVCFSQFAYTCDYDETPLKAQRLTKSPAKESPLAESSPEESMPRDLRQERQIEDVQELAEQSIHFDCGSANTGRKKKKDKKCSHAHTCSGCRPNVQEPESSMREQQWDAFKKATFPDPRPSWASLPFQKESEDHDYADIFLTHARLYTFADYHGISALMDLAIHKLHSRLVNFNLTANRVGAVVELVRYCFTKDTPEPLRNIIVKYAVCQVEKLWRNDEMQQLVGESKELSIALVGAMLSRLD